MSSGIEDALPRKVRIEFELYHIICHGDRREEIFRDEQDRELFLSTSNLSRPVNVFRTANQQRITNLKRQLHAARTDPSVSLAQMHNPTQTSSLLDPLKVERAEIYRLRSTATQRSAARWARRASKFFWNEQAALNPSQPSCSKISSAADLRLRKVLVENTRM